MFHTITHIDVYCNVYHITAMAKLNNRLNALKVKNLRDPGWYLDGECLYLQIGPTGNKNWVFRYKSPTHNKERRHGLGKFPTISLNDARNKAQDCRALLKNELDPIDFKNEQKLKLEIEKQAEVMTFKYCANEYIEAHKPSWRNRKHESQWRNTLETYAYPIIGDMPVCDIKLDHIKSILKPIWNTKTETASRVRQRIESVIDWAIVNDFRTETNPAIWRGRLDKVFPDKGKIQRVRHFPAMPYSELPKFFKHLRTIDTVAAKALAFLILTATRSNEVRNASPQEIKSNIWTIPEERMKARREHRVPLTKEALKILKELKPISTDEYIFPGLSGEKPISDAALLKLVKIHNPELTVHGFRSTFRDWCAEMTSHPREVAEAALAHTIKDKTEAAYQRSDLFEKRKKLMKDWEAYCIA